jgi:iron complex outermembrane receptor protein
MFPYLPRAVACVCSFYFFLFSSVVPLYAADQSLKPVTVTATKYESETDRLPAYITVITSEQIAAANAQTVNEAIMRIGGVTGRTSLTGGNEQSIDLMGFGDTSNLNTVIVVDGIPLREGDATEIRLSGIPVESIDRIEIQRGSASVLYGEGATAGVINIVTKGSSYGKVNANKGSAYFGTGSFGTREYRLNASRTVGAFDLQFYGMDRRSDGFRTHSANENQSGNLSIKFTDKSFRAGLSIRKEDNFTETPGPLTLSEFSQDRRAAQASSVSNNTWAGSNVSRYATFAETELAGIIWRFDAQFKKRDDAADSVLGGVLNRMIFFSDNQFLSVNASRSAENDVWKNHWVMGAEKNDWQQDRYFPDSTISTHDLLKSNSLSFFIKDDLDLKRFDTRISAGYRTELNDRSQLQIANDYLLERERRRSAWELGIAKNVTPDQVVFARVAKSYRFANIDELATATWDGSKTIELRPQTSRDKEIGWRHRAEAGQRISMRVYESVLDDEIIYDAVNFANINLDPTVRRGMDVDYSVPMSSSLSFASSVSFRDARFRSGQYAGLKVPMAAREVLSARLLWKPLPRHAWGVDTQWIAKQQVAGDFSNQNTIPGYATTDVRYTYKQGAIDLSLVVKNIFDRTYYAYATRAYTSDYSSIYNAVYPDPGRAIWVSARVHF